MINKHIILASASPRRRELLESFGFDFEICRSLADENGVENYAPQDAVTELALRKALWVKERCKNNDSVILAADTLVAIDGKLLGKPEDEEDAFRMLKGLSGTNHQVYTGYAILYGDKQISGYECTDVFFRPLEEEEIRAYIATGEPMDKAGAYGIQEKAGIFVRRIEGDYLNVLGLPVCKIYEELKKL
ncbi:MAG: septum formation inhibitor Maf [Ruminococcaceae bacterium]|nr:septum formation inhibitor Maf [Oscillospiraceae bacterium]